MQSTFIIPKATSLTSDTSEMADVMEAALACVATCLSQLTHTLDVRVSNVPARTDRSLPRWLFLRRSPAFTYTAEISTVSFADSKRPAYLDGGTAFESNSHGDCQIVSIGGVGPPSLQVIYAQYVMSSALNV
jgi:hypothetical protein